ncbi:MAG: T9SS type A sorting domain-containing protein [Saprospiraceae bacterium]
MKGILYLLLFYPTLLVSQNTHFVKANASGLGNGSSWDNAFQDLQSAILVALPEDEIWVANGVYKPTTTQERNNSFEIPSQVRVFGGFTGVETNPSQRDFTLGETILDGNIGDLNSASDNSYHVVVIKDGNQGALLDGFIIKNGFANGNGTNNRGGGIWIHTSNQPDSSYATISNCTFLENYAARGACCAITGFNGKLPVTQFRNSVFQNSTAQYNGGGVFIDGHTLPNNSIVFDSCSIIKCKSNIENGGGMALENFGGTLIIQNCLFEKDSTQIGFEGGGLNLKVADMDVSVQLKNSTFRDCYSAIGGGAAIQDYGFFLNPKFLDVDIDQCRFEQNYSSNEAGGLLIRSGYENTCNINILESEFIGNRSHVEGAAVFIYNTDNGSLNVQVSNSRFRWNRGIYVPGGGAISIRSSGNGDATNDVSVVNTIFSNNRGGYSLTSGQTDKSNSTFVNCVFNDNSTYVFNKNWFPTFDSISKYNFINVYNSVIIDTTEIKRIFYNNSFNPFYVNGYYVNHCLLSKPDCYFDNQSTCGENMLFDMDPMFTDTTFYPEKCSPLINAGNNFWADSLDVELDLASMQRIVFDTIDIGVFEATEMCTSKEFSPPTPASRVQIYPNPVHRHIPFFLSLNNKYDKLVHVQIFNALGTAIASYSSSPDLQYKIQVSGISKTGVYLILLNLDGKTEVHKLIVTE